MSSGSRVPFKNPLVEFIDSRLPIFTLMQREYGVFPTPKNFNYFWNFGAIAMFMLVTMIVTGLFLAMHYTPSTSGAFDSVERIMRDVNYGWLIRYVHANGASFFFVAVYIHLFRGLYYGSYKAPREILWILGVILFLLMMATAFMGYVLPWGQMSLWGATVITNLFSAIPIVGDDLVTLLWGGFSVDNPTLNRFFALHFLLPFIICAVVFLHVWALHVTGSNNPTGVEPKTKEDVVTFHPYYTMKDTFGLLVFLIVFFTFVFFMPNTLGHPDNYTPANPMVTPPHIVPEWYFLPFYAILRAITFDISNPFTHVVLIPAKLGGVLMMFGSIGLLFILPWLDRHPVRSARYRPLFRSALFLLVMAVFALGMAGGRPAEGIWVTVGQLGTLYYFAFFLIILPVLSRYERVYPLPASIHESTIKKGVLLLLISGVVNGFSFSVLATEQKDSSRVQHTHAQAIVPDMKWSFDGPFGTYDKAALQRGYKVYREVCSACHSMKRMAYRNLSGLGYTEAEIKIIASEYTITDGPDENGDMFERPAKPSDRFKSPFLNDNAAKASNNGALPPDLSLITKARAGSADYVYGILTGYEPVPADKILLPGQNWNTTISGNVIAMAKPLSDGQITYEDGSLQTVDQYAKDVAHFLTYVAEPEMEERKRMGVQVLLFLCVFAAIMYGVKRCIWAKVH